MNQSPRFTLQELSTNHNEWLNIAFYICKDKYLAGDLVQDMYLKLYNRNPQKEINNWYVYVTIKHLFYDHLKQENQFTDIDERTLEEEEKVTDSAYFSLLDRLDEELDSIHWYKKRLIIEKQVKSPRVIQQETSINYQHIYRSCQKTEDYLKKKLKKDFEAYQKGLL